MKAIDILSNGFLTHYTSENIQISILIGTLIVTMMIGVYIFMVYRLVTRKTFYSKNFNISIAAIAVITSAIILAVQSNLVISLGMVGALSIVRFRTAVKDPLDLCFLFWSLAVGICCGAHMSEVSIILSAIMTLLVIGLEKLPVSRAPMILVINGDATIDEKEVIDNVRAHTKGCKVKARNIREGSSNIVMELRVKDEYGLVNNIKDIKGVQNVSLVSHDGEVTF